MVAIVGGYQSDFARNITREGGDIAVLMADAVSGTLQSAGLGPEQIDSIHVGNAFGQLYTGQGHLGALPATVEPALTGVPAMRHEAACASGSLAILCAMAEIESGRYDCVLVLGIEIEKSRPGPEAARLQAAAAWVGHETEGVDLIWPEMFEQVAAEYDDRYGLDSSHLRAIGELNLRNARDNPLAQTRSWSLSADSTSDDDGANPVVAGRLRRNDCCQITDGAAGVVLVSDAWSERHGRHRAGARIAGWGHRTVGLPLAEKLRSSRDEEYVMPHVRGAITDAFGRAGISGVDALSAIETHDCMTPSEYMAIDHFGITGPGESWKAIENGELERHGRIPVNASGGLIGGGHPVGATGVRMLVDAAAQVRGTAGACQVDGATRIATLNIGGSTATTVSFIVEGAQIS